MEGMQDVYVYGRNPTEPIVANYRNLKKQDTDYVGGFTSFMGAYRMRSDGSMLDETIGADFKTELTAAGSMGCVHVYAGRNNNERIRIMFG